VPGRFTDETKTDAPVIGAMSFRISGVIVMCLISCMIGYPFLPMYIRFHPFLNQERKLECGREGRQTAAGPGDRRSIWRSQSASGRVSPVVTITSYNRENPLPGVNGRLSAKQDFLILSAASRDLLNPLPPPGRRLEGVREVLRLVHDLTVAELHNAHCVCLAPLIDDCVFRDPEITFPENSPNVEAGRLARMMTPQGLQIAAAEDSLT